VLAKAPPEERPLPKAPPPAVGCVVAAVVPNPPKPVVVCPKGEAVAAVACG